MTDNPQSTTTRLQRVLAVALLICLLLTVYVAVIEPGANHYESLDEALENARFQRGKLLSAAEVIRVASSNSSTVEIGEFALTGTTAAAASSNLQRWLRTESNAHEASIRSMTGSVSDAEFGLQKIRTRLHLQSELSRIGDFLYEIETHSPILIVEQMVLRKLKTKVANDNSSRHSINAQFDIVAFYAENKN